MFKLISLNYTETMNGYSHEVNIGGGGDFIEKSVMVSVILVFSHKKDAIQQIYCIFVVCALI